MTHIKEYCKTPRTRWRKVGDLWMCDCGTLWRLNKIPYYTPRNEWCKVKVVTDGRGGWSFMP